MHKTQNRAHRIGYRDAWQRAVRHFEADRFRLDLSTSQLEHWVQWGEWMVRQFGHHRKVAQMAPAGDLNKIVKPLLHKIIFSIARVYAGSSGVALRNFTLVAGNFTEVHPPSKAAMVAYLRCTITGQD